jgi:hypothetical protein
MNSEKDPLSSYIIHFSSIWEYDEIFHAFMSFLKSELNGDTLECILHLKNLTMKSKSDQGQSFSSIYENYFKVNSKKEVNINSTCRKSMDDFFVSHQEGTLKSLPYEFFHSVVRSLSEELALDNFPRFVRDKSTQNLLKKYIADSRVMVPQVSLTVSPTDSEFATFLFKKSDFEFMNQLAQDSFDWKLILGKRRANLYTSHTDFVPKSKLFTGGYALKVETVVPVGMERLMITLFHQSFPKILNDKIQQETFDTFSIDSLKELYPKETVEYPCGLFSAHLKGSLMVTTRVIQHIHAMDYDPETKTMLYLWKPYIGNIKHDENTVWEDPQSVTIKGKEEKAYISADMHLIKLRYLEDNVTQVTHVKLFDPKGYLGNLGDNVVKVGLVLIGKKLRKSILSLMKSKPEDYCINKYKDELLKDPLKRLLLEELERKRFVPMMHPNSQ